jgi:uncharacterized GH25 family protein
MTRRPLFVLTGLIAVLALGFTGLWFLMQKPPARPVESEHSLSNPVAPVAPAESATVEAASESAAPERQVVAKAPAEKKSSAEVLTPLEAELKNALWVEGHVRFPDGTPPDEKVVVEARGKKFASDTLHSVAVGRDGSFRVAFAPGTRTGWLRLKGRYVYLSEEPKVKLPAKPGAPLAPLELAPLLGGLIRGHVTLPPGATAQETNLHGTKVQAWRSSFRSGDEADGMRNLGGEIGADERFEIGGVPSKGAWAVHIDAEAFTRVQRSDVKVEAGKAVDLDLPLKLGARLSGAVVDEDGQPVPDATFMYQSPNDSTGNGWTNYHGKKSAADGTFDLRGTPTMKGNFEVEKQGFLAERQEFGALAEGSAQPGLRIVLRRGNAIAGSVSWPEGQPVAGAQVLLRFKPEETDKGQSFSGINQDEQSTKTDSEGKFRFTGLSRGTGSLQVEAKAPALKADADAKVVEASSGPEAEGQPDAAAPKADESAAKPASKPVKGRKWTAVAEDVQAGTQNLALTLNAGYPIQGRVLDSSNAPIKEFQVRAEPLEKERQEWQPARGTVTGRFSDADGRFTLEGLHEGDWLVRAESKNAPACAPQQIHVPGQGTALVIVLAPACTVSGVVVDPKGQPARGTRVRAEPERDESSRFVFNGNRKYSASSDAEGKFEISGIPPGPLSLRASSEEWAEPEAQALDLAAGQKLEGVRLVLRTPGRILGLVLDRAGHVDGGRPVSLSGTSGSSWQQTTSDANGRFNFDKLAPGDYHLYTQAKQEEFEAAGGDQTKVNRVWQEQQRSLMVKVAEGATSEVTLGGMPKNALHLVGRVSCGGQPVAGAYLQTWRRQRAEGDEPQDFHASADDDGRYDLVLGGPGDYTINVSAGASGSSTSISFEVKVGSEPQQTRDFELPGARISGRVVDRRGKPQAGVWLQLGGDSKARGEGGRGVSGYLSSDEEGRFVFEHVAPGTYEISCGGADRGWNQGSRSGRTTRSGLVVEPGKSLEGIEIVAQPACRVEGTVTAPDGTPVAGAQVSVVDEQGKSLVGWSRETTDGSGHFDFDALPPGRAAFLAQKGALTSGYSSWVTVGENGATKVDLALQNGTTVYVETADADGAHVQADMQVFDSRGLDVTGAGFRSAPTAEAPPGRRIGPLAPGKYNLVVMRKDKPDLRQELSVAGEPTKAVLVRCD